MDPQGLGERKSIQMMPQLTARVVLLVSTIASFLAVEKYTDSGSGLRCVHNVMGTKEGASQEK